MENDKPFRTREPIDEGNAVKGILIALPFGLGFWIGLAFLLF